MKYCVSEDLKKLVLAWAGVILLLFLFGFPTAMAVITDYEGIRDFLPFCIFAFIGAAALGWLLIYCLMRPRIKVCRNKMICYPRFKKKEVIEISDITQRRTEIFNDKSAVSFAGAAGYGATGGKSGVLMKITYFVKEREIITIHTGMRNAQKLELSVKKALEANE